MKTVFLFLFVFILAISFQKFLSSDSASKGFPSSGTGTGTEARKEKILTAARINNQTKDFDLFITENKEPILVDFWAPWCPPCVAMGPIVDEVATIMEGKALVTKINVDENPELSQKYGIEAIPTFIFFRNGKPVKKMRGSQSKETLLNTLRTI